MCINIKNIIPSKSEHGQYSWLQLYVHCRCMLHAECNAITLHNACRGSEVNMEHFSSDANFTQSIEDWSVPICSMVKGVSQYVHAGGVPQ